MSLPHGSGCPVTESWLLVEMGAVSSLYLDQTYWVGRRSEAEP